MSSSSQRLEGMNSHLKLLKRTRERRLGRRKSESLKNLTIVQDSDEHLIDRRHRLNCPGELDCSKCLEMSGSTFNSPALRMRSKSLSNDCGGGGHEKDIRRCDFRSWKKSMRVADSGNDSGKSSISINNSPTTNITRSHLQQSNNEEEGVNTLANCCDTNTNDEMFKCLTEENTVDDDESQNIHVRNRDGNKYNGNLWRRLIPRIKGRSSALSLLLRSLLRWARMSSYFYTFLVLVTTCLSNLPVSYGCSSRSTPKPRPPSPTLRPNITIQTYTCPPEYDAHYCLNGATCFTVKIGESILYNCECAEGYMGQRCEFKDLDGSYLPSKQRALLEQAGVTGAGVIMVIIVAIVCFYLYVQRDRRRKIRRSNREGGDAVDGQDFERHERRPFSQFHYTNPSLSISQNIHHHQSGMSGRTAIPESVLQPQAHSIHAISPQIISTSTFSPVTMTTTGHLKSPNTEPCKKVEPPDPAQHQL